MFLDLITNDLMDALHSRRLTQLPSERGQLSIADSYLVAARHTAMRRARGEITVGRKIGFTNRAIWPDYGIDSPLWGHMYAGGIVNAETGHAQVAVRHLVAPRIEPEMILGLAEPVVAHADAETLAAQVAWVALGFEIVDCHYLDWRFTIPDIIADFGLHANLVVGKRRMVSPADASMLAALLPTVKVTLEYDGVVLHQGSGANALGSPLLALGYLADTIAAHGSEPLMPGELVTTGTLTPAVAIRAGHTWRVSSDWDALASVEVELV